MALPYYSIKTWNMRIGGKRWAALFWICWLFMSSSSSCLSNNLVHDFRMSRTGDAKCSWQIPITQQLLVVRVVVSQPLANANSKQHSGREKEREDRLNFPLSSCVNRRLSRRHRPGIKFGRWSTKRIYHNCFSRMSVKLVAEKVVIDRLVKFATTLVTIIQLFS